MSDFASQPSKLRFDPSVLADALKRRFPAREDDAFSGLLAQIDAAECRRALDNGPRSAER